MPASSPPRSPMPPARRLIALLLLPPVIVALALWAFAWPAARTAPRELPVGLVGPPAATAPVEQKLNQHDPGAFEIHRYGDEEAARDAIEQREVYGALVATPDGPRALTASAAGPVTAQVLQQAVSEGSLNGGAARVSDVVAAPDTDP
ncbi:MAG TPA: ABC transporter permease, partial [Streptomyces sp.]|nr:ABC transporter permease [Streptomyces sp.]